MVDNYVIGEGEPGPITRRLVKTYWDWHADPAYSQALDYSL
jgi:branched-chain amino acid aminotransferase